MLPRWPRACAHAWTIRSRCSRPRTRRGLRRARGPGSATARGSPTRCSGCSPMAERIRVVVVATHPIQYYSPWFRGLAAASDLDFKVLYLRKLDAGAQGTGFGVPFQWDVDLLAGYDSATLSTGGA